MVLKKDKEKNLRSSQRKYITYWGRAVWMTCFSHQKPWRPTGSETACFKALKGKNFSLFSPWIASDSLQLHGLQHVRFPCPSPSPGVCSNSCSLSQWCHLTVSSSDGLLSFCVQSFPASGSFPVSWLFASDSQSTGASASASVLPMNIQNWFPLGWTGWISLQSEGLSRFFSNTTVQKHQFFGAQLSLWSNSHIHTWLLEKP